MIPVKIIDQAKKSIAKFVNNSNKTNPNFYTGYCLIKNGRILQEKNDSLYVNLASASKPFLIYFLGLSLEKYKDIKNINDKFKVTPALVRELINRKKENFFSSKKKFKKVTEWIEMQKIGKDNKVNTDLKFPNAYINFPELCEIVLTYSSNQGSILAKNKLDEIFKNHEHLQKEFDEMGIAQTLELNKGEFEFWNQSGANTGRLRDIALSFDKLFNEDDKELNPQQHKVKKQAIKSLKWGKCFGLEQDLQKMDQINMWCKDGIIWPVVWGRKLSKQGFPPHLSIGLLLRIKSKEDSYTLAYFKAVEVKLPKDIDYTKFPDYIDDKKYNAYISIVKQKYNMLIYSEVKKLLIKEGIVKNYRSNLLNLIKMHAKLNYYYIKSRF